MQSRGGGSLGGLGIGSEASGNLGEASEQFRGSRVLSITGLRGRTETIFDPDRGNERNRGQEIKRTGVPVPLFIRSLILHLHSLYFSSTFTPPTHSSYYRTRWWERGQVYTSLSSQSRELAPIPTLGCKRAAHRLCKSISPSVNEEEIILVTSRHVLEIPTVGLRLGRSVQSMGNIEKSKEFCLAAPDRYTCPVLPVHCHQITLIAYRKSLDQWERRLENRTQTPPSNFSSLLMSILTSPITYQKQISPYKAVVHAGELKGFVRLMQAGDIKQLAKSIYASASKIWQTSLSPSLSNA